MRAKVFVSYSHRDASWLNMCKSAFGSGFYAKALDIWSDEKINRGDDWEQRIETSIAGSRIALLLVSRNFLQSDFIAEREYSTILDQHTMGDLKIWWLPLERITKTELELAKLDGIQSAWPIERPLSELSNEERADAFAKLFEAIVSELKLLIDTTDDARATLKQSVQETLGKDTRLSETVAVGDFSIIYSAKRRYADVAVKALVPSTRLQWLGGDFINRANLVRRIKNSSVVRIIEVINNHTTPCIVMDLVNAPTLKVRLMEEGRLPANLVARILKHLARVAAQLQKMEGEPIIGPIRPSQVYYDEKENKVQVSLVHISNETMTSCRPRKTLLLDDDALTYLSSERYDGQNVDAASDQYYLGLLGLELLNGKPPVEVTTFNDLERKKNFFDAPRSFFEDLHSENPAFSFVLARMLERSPQNRWCSMSNLIAALQQLENGLIPDAVREHADENYDRKLRNNRIFFQSFYKNLFELSSEIKVLFERRRVSMDDQYRKLDRAMGSILSFNSRLKATTLDPQIDSHGDFGLKGEHFEFFREAFLDALRDTEANDDYSQEAWHAILNPALDYMRDRFSH